MRPSHVTDLSESHWHRPSPSECCEGLDESCLAGEGADTMHPSHTPLPFENSHQRACAASLSSVSSSIWTLFAIIFKMSLFRRSTQPTPAPSLLTARVGDVHTGHWFHHPVMGNPLSQQGKQQSKDQIVWISVPLGNLKKVSCPFCA